jgi:hypothetical protein
MAGRAELSEETEGIEPVFSMFIFEFDLLP